MNRYNVDTVYPALDRIQSRYKPRYRELEVSCDTAVSDSFATRGKTPLPVVPSVRHATADKLVFFHEIMHVQ